MDWWLIPVLIGGLLLFRLLWVAAFHPAETVNEAGPASEVHLADRGPNDEGASVAAPESSPDKNSGDDGGIWIELDITPLFASSESHQIVDVTEAEGPDVTS